ncbi:ArsR/SmtB family transcription factor [Phyllobacterium myrsinacearum]|uniref:DNA-binding transcriptional ArsR family regulator n=1 Tax=Phyllobacterium myrsinacearum TaxID=28101 RepID=A0A839EIU9_9HYPH|nr:winged helix-turn-helix domain-containing protein [Phyllobacterium myrsinacearum]MBA8877416.1 DNA-binding transcriptional ArsR family regulator [Phyllobacterium myrsinacearum]
MTHPLFHPDAEEISLPAVLTALGDETRLSIIAILARNGERAMTCGEFLQLGSKTALSYHVAKLREAGVINVRPDGTKRLLTLRRIDLETRFPGFLASIIISAGTVRLPENPIMADAAEAPGETEWT